MTSRNLKTTLRNLRGDSSMLLATLRTRTENSGRRQPKPSPNMPRIGRCRIRSGSLNTVFMRWPILSIDPMLMRLHLLPTNHQPVHGGMDREQHRLQPTPRASLRRPRVRLRGPLARPPPSEGTPTRLHKPIKRPQAIHRDLSARHRQPRCRQRGLVKLSLSLLLIRSPFMIRGRIHVGGNLLRVLLSPKLRHRRRLDHR